MNATLRWLAVALGVAVLAHGASVWYAPRLIMARVMDGIAAAGGRNVFIDRPLADAGARTIVRPSPDLMYSICVLDLSRGPVRILAPASAPYTSVSVFAANSDNVFVMNDRDLADGASFEVWVARAGQSVPVSLPVAILPSDDGIALVRRVVTDPEQARSLDTLRREARCERAD